MAKKKMPVKVAKEFLAGCTAHTDLFVPGFLGWKRDGREVASGLFSKQRNHVQIHETKKYAMTTYEGARALALKDLGNLQPEVLEGVTCCRMQVTDSGNKRP